MPNDKARPQAQPPAPRMPNSTETATAIRSAALVKTTKEQEDFQGIAVALAASLGWEGESTWILNGIQISDAQSYLTKALHEVHVAALNKAHKRPSAADVCVHLGLPPETTEVGEAFDAVWREESGTPASPTS